MHYDRRDDSGDDKTTLSAVLRPIYKVNQNLSVQMEAGVTYARYSDDKGTEGQDRNALQYKFTIAPSITLDAFDHNARPQIRAFVSAFWWNDAAFHRNDESLVSGANGEVRFGLQGEIWF